MLEADRIADRRRLKRTLTVWRIVAIAAMAALAIVAAGVFANRGGLAGDYIARLRVEDIIVAESWRDDAFEDIAGDDRCKALIVRIDSPGGTFVGGESVMLGLRRIAAAKPVVAVLGDMATSGAYMSALGADHIIASSGTLTGSIGVILQTAQFTDLMSKLGIEPITIKSGALKATPNPLEPLSQPARAALQDTVMDTFAQFVDMVVERRKIERAAIAPLTDGRVVTGRQALSLGLIDALGDEMTARRWLESEKGVVATLPTHDIEPPEDVDLLRNIIFGSLGKVLSSERLRLDGLLALWQPDLR